MYIAGRLSKVFDSSTEITFDNSSKFILFSDCHRGDNGSADDFAPNQNLFFYALDFYYEKGFTYIEIGDGDELWENRNFEDIRNAYDHIFWRLSNFYKDNRLYLIWGNHNRKWKRDKNVRKYLYSYFEERKREPGLQARLQPLFEGIKIHEGIILRHLESNKKLFLVHGHQGDLMNDQLWWVGEFIVRNIWRFFQFLGVKDPTSPAKNFKKRQILERAMVKWLNNNKNKLAFLIAGHTHRPYLPGLNESPYCNTGSCVHPRCITGIEIENGEIKLIKWFVDVNLHGTGSLFINNEIIEGPRKLQDFTD